MRVELYAWLRTKAAKHQIPATSRIGSLFDIIGPPEFKSRHIGEVKISLQIVIKYIQEFSTLGEKQSKHV
jgi:hypothetical protein